MNDETMRYLFLLEMYVYENKSNLLNTKLNFLHNNLQIKTHKSLQEDFLKGEKDVISFY